MNINKVNMSLCTEGLTPHNTSPTTPSEALIQMCQIQQRGKPPRLLLIHAIMEFHATKLSWLTVTVQWFGSMTVTWLWRASSLSEAIMRKWSFAIELCNDKYWLISALIIWFKCVIGLWAYRVASNCTVVCTIMIHFLNPPFLSSWAGNV